MEDPLSEIEWARYKAAELAKLAERNAIVIVPIGSTEQHGPHLPTQVDTRLVTEVAQRAARVMSSRHPTLVTPTIPFGMSEHHMSLNGTITLDYATMAGILGCVCHSILRDGFKRIFVLNGHGGNTDGIYTFISEFTVKHRVPLAGGTYWNIAQTEIAQILEKQKALLHACEAETSMMLALSRADRSRWALTGPGRSRSWAQRHSRRECWRLPLASACEPLAERRYRRGWRGEPREGRASAPGHCISGGEGAAGGAPLAGANLRRIDPRITQGLERKADRGSWRIQECGARPSMV
jgi:creatinine amidohydrolase/Fe(II)-dependent formamide hydrolase-like protein